INNIKMRSNTPMAEEKDLQLTPYGIFFNTYFDDRLTIHQINNNKEMHHFTIKSSDVTNYTIENNKIITKSFSIDLSNIDLNSKYYFYKKTELPIIKTDLNNIDLEHIFNISKIKKMSSNIFNKFNKNSKITNILSIDNRYVKELNHLFKDSIELYYYEISIPNRNYLKLFVFDKNSFFINFVDSGDYRYSKTGEVFSKKVEKDSILIEIPKLRAGKIEDIVIKPASNNSTTLLITPKNQILYTIDSELKEIDNIQFDYPLIFKNNQNVSKENIKINLIEENQKERYYSGICLKDNYIISFWGDLTRGTLIDYLYLLSCDYAFETAGGEINFTENERYLNDNRVPTLSLTPKKIESKDYIIDNNEIFESYRFLCSNISINYRKGLYDPMSNNIKNSNSSGVLTNMPVKSLYTGAIDPIFPDGLYYNNTTFYKPLDKDSFYIDDFSCGIGERKERSSFFKEGFVIRKNGISITPKEEKYQNILLAVAKDSYWIRFYQFKKATPIDEVISILEQKNISDAIVFENSSNLFPINSLPKIEIILSKDSEIKGLK
ncbi:hypothetical protein JXR93_06195, partial [bacterium]|nr:hypothetical protein [bacterium]